MMLCQEIGAILIMTNLLKKIANRYVNPFLFATFNSNVFLKRGCRYDGQAAVFGWKYQNALFSQKWFVVGAGGCQVSTLCINFY